MTQDKTPGKPIKADHIETDGETITYTTPEGKKYVWEQKYLTARERNALMGDGDVPTVVMARILMRDYAERMLIIGSAVRETARSLEPHPPLPVQGYTSQPDTNVVLVNEHKIMEERVLRRIDALPGYMTDRPDMRWLNIARTHIEQGFMALNRAVFQPQRAKLPEDVASSGVGDMQA